MKYKKNLVEVVDRNKKLWTGSYTNGILAKIEIEGHNVLDMWIYALSPEILPDKEKMFDAFISNFHFREHLLDDAIPTARPSLGSSAYGAFFGADLQFGTSGAYSKPILQNIREYKKLRYSFEDYWLAKQIDATNYFVEKAEGLSGVCIIETMDNLNLAENLVGSKIYIDLIDNPKVILDFFEMALDFNIRLVTRQREYIKKYKNGYFDIHEIWVSGDAVWMSIDAWNLVGPNMFRKLGVHHIQKCIDYFGGAWLHMHNQAMHLLPDVVKLKGLLGIGLLDDPTEPRCFPRLREIQRITKDMPLQINCTKDEFCEGIKNKSLPKNIMYWVDSGVESVEEANRIMEMLYEY
jgi:hypothetical protein